MATPRVHLQAVENLLYQALTAVDQAATEGVAWSTIEPLRASVLAAIDANNHAATDGYAETARPA